MYGRMRRKVIVAVAVDHDVTAANGSGAIDRDAGEAVNVFLDVAPAAGPQPAAAKSGKGGMVGKKRTGHSTLLLSVAGA